MSSTPLPSSPVPAHRGLLVLTLLALVLFAPALLDAFRLGQPLGGGGGDVQLQFHAWRDRDFSRLASGELPLLDPLVFAGQSVPGNWQRAIFYPPNLLHLALPTSLAITTLAFLHSLLAGVLTLGWLRSKGLHNWAATLGAAAFMCSGVYLGRAFPGHLTWLAVAAWSPAVFWALDRLLDTGRLRPAVWGALAVAMMLLGGYPQPAYITLVAGALYLLLMFFESPHRLRAVGGFALMCVLGATLAAPAVLPGLEAAAESVRSGALPFDVASRTALPLSHLLLPLAPLAFGGISPHAHSTSLPWETFFWFGAIPAVLALTAATFVHTPARRRALTMVVIFTLLALGTATPLFRVAFELLPFASGFRVPARWLLPAVLFACLLAATAFDALLRDDRRVTLAARAAFVLTGVALVCLGFLAPAAWFAPGSWQLALVLSGLVLAAAGAVPLFVTAVRLPARFAVPALGLLTFAELAYFSRPFVVTSPTTPALSPAITAALRTVPPDTRVQLLHPDLANAPTSLGLPVALAYDPFMPRRLAEVLAAAQGIDPRNAADLSPALRPDSNETILRLLRVSRLIAPDGTYRDITSPLPRALLVPQADIQPLPALTLARLVSPAFDPAARVILESSPVFPPAPDAPDHSRTIEPDSPNPASTPTTRPASYTARVTAAPRSERLEVAVTVPRHAFLLITDAYSPAWSARRSDTGESLSVVPANHALLAVPVPPGEYTVELTYRPRTLTPAFVLAALGIVAWFTALATTKNRRTPSLTPAGQVE